MMRKEKIYEASRGIMILVVMAVALTFVLPGAVFSAPASLRPPKISSVSVLPNPAIAGQTVLIQAEVNGRAESMKVRLSGMKNEQVMDTKRSYYVLYLPMMNPGSYTFEVVAYYGNRQIGDTKKGTLVVNPAPPPPNVTQVSTNAPIHSVGHKVTFQVMTDRPATSVTLRIPGLNFMTGMRGSSTAWTGEWSFAKPGTYTMEVTAYDHLKKPGTPGKGSLQLVAEDLPPNVTGVTVTPPSPPLAQQVTFSATTDRPSQRVMLNCSGLKITNAGMQFKDNKWIWTQKAFVPGNHPFQVTAFNKQNKPGQAGKSVVNVTFDYSQPPPSISRIDGSLYSRVRSDLPLDITTDRQTANVYINFPQRGGDISLKRKRDDSGRSWSVRIHMLTAGKIPIEFVAEDYAGRKGPAKTVVIDVKPKK